MVSTESTTETRATVSAVNILDGFKLSRVAIDQLKEFSTELHDGLAMPVGSVEFVQEAIKVGDLATPQFSTYNFKIPHTYWGRKIVKCAKLALGGIKLLEFDEGSIFIKPERTKLFTGFIIKSLDPDKYPEFEREQFNVFLKLKPSEKLFVSEVVNFTAEWRVYVLKGEVIGICRYDDLESEEYEVDDFLVSELVCDPELEGKTYAVDIGELEDGNQVIVEFNDAWAIGLYPGLVHKDYFKFLLTRWEEICHQLR